MTRVLVVPGARIALGVARLAVWASALTVAAFLLAILTFGGRLLGAKPRRLRASRSSCREAGTCTMAGGFQLTDHVLDPLQVTSSGAVMKQSVL